MRMRSAASRRSAVMQLSSQEVFWVPESKCVDLPGKPLRVWTLAAHSDPNTKPVLPIIPQHGFNAFLEDERHDWTYHMLGGEPWLKYNSRMRDHSVWILCEFKP